MCIYAQICVCAPTFTRTHVSWPENEQTKAESLSLPLRTAHKTPQASLTLFADLLDCCPPQFRRDGGFGMNPGSN